MYLEKMSHANYSDQEMINLPWKLKELDELNKTGRKFHSDIVQVIATISDSVCVEENIPVQLKDILTRHQQPTSLCSWLAVKSAGGSHMPFQFNAYPTKGL